MSNAYAMVLPYMTPTSRAPTSPGPAVTVTPVRLSEEMPASATAWSTTAVMDFRCSLLANSGTTPPKIRCTS